MTDFIFLGSKITADGDCSHEIKRQLLLGRKAVTNLDNILKSRDITLPTKVCLVKATVLLVVTYGCESWTIKKAEHWRIDAFELWCWRRLLRVPWTARRSNHLILREIRPEYSLEGLMLKLKLQYFGCPIQRTDLLENARKDWRWEEKGMTEDEMVGWHHWLNGHKFEQALGVGDGRGSLACCSQWGCKELHVTETELNCRHVGSLLDARYMGYIFLSFYFQLFTSLCLLWWYIVRSSLLHVTILCLWLDRDTHSY